MVSGSEAVLYKPPGAARGAHLKAGSDEFEVRQVLYGAGRAGAPDSVHLGLRCALQLLIARQVVHRVAEDGRVVVDAIQEGQHLQPHAYSMSHRRKRTDGCNEALCLPPMQAAPDGRSEMCLLCALLKRTALGKMHLRTSSCTSCLLNAGLPSSCFASNSRVSRSPVPYPPCISLS